MTFGALVEFYKVIIRLTISGLMRRLKITCGDIGIYNEIYGSVRSRNVQ